MKNYQFEKSDLLTLKELKYVLRGSRDCEVADMLYEKIKKYVIFYEGSYYQLQDNITYLKTECIRQENFLPILISRLYVASLKLLSIDDDNDLRETYKKQYVNFTKTNCIKETAIFLDQLFSSSDKIVLDVYTNQIHFNNGYIDILTKEFKQRKIGVDYISYFINYDYTKSTSKKQKELLKLTINKIIPDEKDRECMFKIIGSTLTGCCTDDNSSLFIYGKGSGGKSTILDLCQVSMPAYVQEIQNNLFSQASTDYNKVLNSYSQKPQIRLTVCHELKDERIDATRFKLFTEGKVTTTKLFKDGSYDIRHKSKIIFTCNTLPNLIADSGVIRRVKAYEQKTHFTEDKSKVDEENGVFLANKKLKSIVDEDIDYKCAWIDLLVDGAYDYNNTKNIKYTKNFEVAKEQIISANDWIQDFIDQNLVIMNATPADKDKYRIGKNSMLSMINYRFPKRQINGLQLIASMREHNIEYNCDKRADNMKGCFMGVKFRSVDDDEEEDKVEQKVEEKVEKKVEKKVESDDEESESEDEESEDESDDESSDDSDSDSDNEVEKYYKKGCKIAEENLKKDVKKTGKSFKDFF